MNVLNQALSLASRGFHVFPLKPGGKLPAHTGWQDEATRDEETIRRWFSSGRFNVGISTSKFGDDLTLCVVDVDVKKGKHGDETLLGLELQGFDFPITAEHATPSGGKHIIYSSPVALRGGVDVLGTGLDIRARGNLIVAPGSEVEAGAYTYANDHWDVVEVPAWLRDRLGMDRGPAGRDRSSVPGVDPDRAADRGAEWVKTAPAANLGSRGYAAYKAAARLKDLGCDEPTALMLMDAFWSNRCDPPMPDSDLVESVAHAYRYGREPQGSAAPEAVFEAVAAPAEAGDDHIHPFDRINMEYAFIKAGAFVLQETTNEDGEFAAERLPVADFHAWFANQPFVAGKEKPRPISQHWMEWQGRRQYDGVVFSPGQDPGPRWYNLWRGFSVEPAEKASHPALDMFLEHALKNVCNNDPKLFHWLMGYFAHMIQRPWEKPLVALVFKGAKGVGKNALVERVGALLGSHFLVADDDRYLLGNFNSHLESNLCFVLDEAAWAGDKRAEGKLKGLITGKKRLIEHKGKEARNLKNVSRIVILGNEDWLVPATQDERRFAVFAVGEGRMQDRKFFIGMREGMEQGGYAHLLRYLLDFDLSDVDVNEAPTTEALIEQKHASLDTVEQWWLDCLHSGQIAGGDWGGEWPEQVPTNRLREALGRWARGRNIRSRLPEEVGFGRIIARIAPSLKKKKARAEAGDSSYAFINPGLDRLRADWEKFIGGQVKWTE